MFPTLARGAHCGCHEGQNRAPPGFDTRDTPATQPPVLSRLPRPSSRREAPYRDAATGFDTPHPMIEPLPEAASRNHPRQASVAEMRPNMDGNLPPKRVWFRYARYAGYSTSGTASFDTRAAPATQPPNAGYSTTGKKQTSRPVSRVLWSVIIYLRRRVAASLKQPTRAPRASSAPTVSAAGGTGLLGLAPGGVYQAAPVTWDAGGLLHLRFTLTRCRAVCFLWHYPAGHPGWALPTTLLYGARTFLSPTSGPRSPGRLVRRTILSAPCRSITLKTAYTHHSWLFPSGVRARRAPSCSVSYWRSSLAPGC